MNFNTHYRCEVCWESEKIVKITNKNLYLCTKCLKECFPNGYLSDPYKINGLVCGELVEGKYVDVHDIERRYFNG